MKLISTIFLLLIACLVYSQNIKYKKAISITKAEFEKHLLNKNVFFKTAEVKKAHGIIRIKFPNKQLVLKDDGEMQSYKYEGNLKETPLILIHELEPNTEEYYLINKMIGTIDTLVNKPVFYHNEFVCLEGIGTDTKQRIQIGYIEKDRVVIRKCFKIFGNIYPGYVYWFDKNTLCLDVNGTKFYKLTF